MIFSEKALGLEPRWFTGQEWADGTAQRELRREYKAACKLMQEIEDAKTPAQKAADKQAREHKRYLKWCEFKSRC